VLGGGVFFALDLALWNTSIMLTSATTATLLANNTPLWVALGALVILKEQLPPRYWAGLAISLTGMAILVGVDVLGQFKLNLGGALAIGASFFYAAYILTTRRARRDFDTFTFTAISLLSSLLVLFALNLVDGSALLGFDNRTWSALIALGLISQLAGWLAINYALGNLGASRVAVLLLGQSVVTAVFAMPLLGEYLTVSQLAGGALVLSGIYLTQTENKLRPDTKIVG
jgi:drug/metabolite transporter (DMT)-like permease